LAFGAGAKGLLPSLSGRLGCDDAQAVHLTREQHQACVGNLARLAQGAKPLNIYIREGKQIDYDRYVHCQTVYTHAGMPASGSHDPSTPIAGLGTSRASRSARRVTGDAGDILVRSAADPCDTLRC
jgi:hypothetical protein